jgi:hypothetical protein
MILDAGPQHAPRVLRHVFRRAEIHVAAFHARGQPGVGHGAHGLGRVLHHALDGFERGLGADGAVEADYIHRPGIHFAREGFRVGAAGQVSEIVDGDLRDNGNFAAGGLVRGADGFAKFVEVAESFEDQQIDAGFQQRVDLLAEDGAGLGERRGAQRLDAHAQRAHRAGHEGGFLGRFASQAHAGLVDGRQLLGHSEPGQPHAVGAECVGFDDFSARLDVVLVDLADQVGRREIQLVEAAVDEDPAGVEHGAHSAVRHQDAAGQLLAEFLGAVVGGSSHGKRPAVFVILPRTVRGSLGSADGLAAGLFQSGQPRRSSYVFPRPFLPVAMRGAVSFS